MLNILQRTKGDIMLTKFISRFGRNFFDSPDIGLVRLFQTEYNKEYRNAIKQGICVDETYVKEFLQFNPTRSCR